MSGAGPQSNPNYVDFMHGDIFQGFGFMVDPEAGYKSVTDSIDEGMEPTASIKTTAGQFRDFIQPPIEVMRAIPPLAIAPMLLIWFGPTATTQYVMLIGYMFLAIVINTLEAIRNVPQVSIHYALTMGASRGQVFRTIVLPAIVPELVGGIRVGVALAWGIAVVTELLGAPVGIGKVFSMMLTAQGLDIIIISIFYVTIVAFATDRLVVLVAGYVTRWMPRVGR